MNLNRRFPFLSVVSMIMRVIGWLYLLPGLFFGLVVIISYFIRTPHGMGPFALPAAALAAVFGLLLVAVGECIGVLFAIEDNTHAAAEHLYKLVSEKITPKT
jgi:hypothetical protein